ncbi:NAD(+)/NADH kinase [Natrialba sp. INN-245]|uniref:NAD(+)/NADH kinase n=1 Tax=Natrialba sp. INN-245 TaxID=2690967 RepID=UPI0013102CCC|nr:NAD(+)/NADH kinase [Natrialba sp. INN-245]MWV39259.1 NAD(+)/NADH kinase [Natrialba sp. INN-245]
MEGDAWRPDPTSPVGFVESDFENDLEPSDLEAAGTSVVSGPPAEVLEADPSTIVAVGDSAVAAVADAKPDVPVLPVCDVPGIAAVDPNDVVGALESVFRGDGHLRTNPVLVVETPSGNSERALFDVALVTAEPAQISEYSVSSREESVAQFRADGVVAATPAGSHGYAETIDGPLLSTAVEGVVVVPIAPFVTQTCRWVLPNDGVALSVERDQPPVVLCVDDRTVERISAGERVSITADGTLSTVVIPESTDERG